MPENGRPAFEMLRLSMQGIRLPTADSYSCERNWPPIRISCLLFKVFGHSIWPEIKGWSLEPVPVNCLPVPKRTKKPRKNFEKH